MLWPRNTSRWQGKGDKARDERDWAAAIQFYEKHLELYPEDCEIRTQLGHAYKEAGFLNLALNAYDASLSSAKDELGTKRIRAYLLREMNRTEDAIDGFVECHTLPECRAEAIHLGGASKLRTSVEKSARKNNAPVWLEVGDMVRYHIAHPRPSGIQRVIANCVVELLHMRDDISLIMITSGGLLQEVTRKEFMDLIALSSEGEPEEIQSYAENLYVNAPFITSEGEGLILTFGAFWEDQTFLDVVEELRAKGRSLISIVHDLIPLTHPEFAAPGVAARMRPAFSRLYALADQLIAVSDQTRTAMLNFGAAEAKCHTIRLCHEFEQLSRENSQLGSLIGGRRFVLSVGTIEPRKNQEILLRLWLTYQREGKSPPLLALVGRMGWGVEDLMSRFEATEDAAGSIIQLGSTTDAELGQLYRECDLTIFPSFVEGWGLPAGESLVCGKVCVASSAVGGVSDALLEFNPNDLSDLRRILDPLLFDKNALKAATERVARTFVERKWKDVAEELDQAISYQLTRCDTASTTFA